MIKKWNIVMLLLMTVLLLSGCNMMTVDELYCLPMRSEQYTNLQSVMQQAMQGMEYSAPLSGENQQTVQAADLDGDGNPEYLLFAKDNSEKPLHIFVFSGDGENYFLLDTIESTGSAFDKVEYIQMDGIPGYEIVVGYQVSDQVVRSVTVHNLTNGHLEQIMSTNYTRFLSSDLNNDGCSEVFILRPGETGNGVAVIYGMEGKTLERSQEISMSQPADNIMRIMKGKLYDGVSAVYVASSVSGSDGIVTDVYALNNQALHNISFSTESGTSIQTLRNHYVYADDIDGDGVLELPRLISVKSGIENNSSANQYVIRWFALTSEGDEVDKVYTYHNFVGGWYMELEASYAQRTSVVQQGSSYEFYLWNDTFTQAEKLMTLYVLTGQKREEQALINNRFVVSRGESTIYAASLEVASSGYGITQENLIDAFHLIQEDWNTGET